MKNILLLAVFLFIASFSFLGCSDDDPMDSIVGPTIGAKGDKGDPGESVITDLIGADQHVDLAPNGSFWACAPGFHVHPDSPDSVCRDDNNLDANGCAVGQFWARNSSTQVYNCLTIPQ